MASWTPIPQGSRFVGDPRFTFGERQQGYLTGQGAPQFGTFDPRLGFIGSGTALNPAIRAQVMREWQSQPPPPVPGRSVPLSPMRPMRPQAVPQVPPVQLPPSIAQPFAQFGLGGMQMPTNSLYDWILGTAAMGGPQSLFPGLFGGGQQPNQGLGQPIPIGFGPGASAPTGNVQGYPPTLGQPSGGGRK